jgi:hypothetical protein
MKSYLDRVIAEVPTYMGYFTQSLTSPRVLLTERLSLTETQKAVEDGVKFLIVSFLIALFISHVFPAVTRSTPINEAEFIKLGSNALFKLFLFIGEAAIAYLAWRAVGARLDFQRFVGGVAFICGVTLVLYFFVSALSNLAMLDPIFARAIIEIEGIGKKFDLGSIVCAFDFSTGQMQRERLAPGLVEALERNQNLFVAVSGRTWFQITGAIQILASAVIVGWVSMAWFAIGNILQVSRVRTILAGVIMLIGVVLVELLVGLLDMASLLMQAMRTC